MPALGTPGNGGSSWTIPSPATTRASAVRLQARKVRSFANVNRGSGSVPSSSGSGSGESATPAPPPLPLIAENDVAAASEAGVPEAYLGLFAHANVWPADDPGLRGAAFGYLAACLGLAERMLGLYARAHSVPEDAFAMGRLPHVRLTVNDYPTWTYPATTADEDKLLLLEHADDSAVTILAQQGDYEGLQVQAPDGTWIGVPITPGALQVFSGTLLARWTGGLLRPGRHRVVAGGTVTRRSTAVFVYPSLDAVVEPFGPFAADPAMEPVLVWDHVKDRVADYLGTYGRPEQIAAWRDGQPYVAELAEDSAGR